MNKKEMFNDAFDYCEELYRMSGLNETLIKLGVDELRQARKDLLQEVEFDEISDFNFRMAIFETVKGTAGNIQVDIKTEKEVKEAVENGDLKDTISLDEALREMREEV